MQEDKWLLPLHAGQARDPTRETVILTTHGMNDDACNAQWIELLESIANKMRTNGGAAFRVRASSQPAPRKARLRIHIIIITIERSFHEP